MHYYCQCLNVTIDVLEVNEKPSTKFIPFANLSEGWLECHLLSEQSINICWHSLLQSITVRDMQLYRCLVCNQYTHITNNESNGILINKDLLNERTVTDRYSDPNYSKILKIVLPTGLNYSSMTRSTAVPNENYPKDYELVQQIYRQSLDDAELETEEKIRIYQQEQEEILRKKTETINKELNTFLQFMHSISHQTSSIKSSPLLQTSIPFISENSLESGFGSDVFDASGTESSRQSSVIERTFSERNDNLDEDPMLDNIDWSNGKDSSSNFGRSLPKNITLRSFPISHRNDDEKDELERIGKSFRELSQSLMCTDGTELFGDLPSPRLNAR